MENLLKRTWHKRNIIQFYILLLVWVLSNLFYLYQYGIVTGFEASKYIEQANNLIIKHSYSSNNFIFYSTQIILIALSIKSGSGYILVIFMQMAANGLSVFFFYKLIERLTRNKYISFVITFLFLCMYYYQLYNVHLFTESFFFSLSILYTYFLFSVAETSTRNIALIIFGLLILYLTRPTGVYFIPSTFLFLILKFYRKTAPLLIISFLVLTILIFFLLLNLAMATGDQYNFLLPYTKEMVICDIPTYNGEHKILIPTEKNSIQGLWYIITNYTALFINLAIKRSIAFLGVIRPYYSKPHNVFIAFYFYSTYILSIIGFRKLMHNCMPHTVYLICYISLVTLTVILSCDEWHNRFILSLLPFFLILSCGRWIKRVN